MVVRCYEEATGKHRPFRVRKLKVLAVLETGEECISVDKSQKWVIGAIQGFNIFTHSFV